MESPTTILKTGLILSSYMGLNTKAEFNHQTMGGFYRQHTEILGVSKTGGVFFLFEFETTRRNVQTKAKEDSMLTRKEYAVLEEEA